MDSEDRLVATIVKCVAASFCVLIVSLAGCDMRTRQIQADTIADMVRAGANPQVAACALRTSKSGYDCMLLASRTNQ